MDTAPRVYDSGKGVWQLNGLALGDSDLKNSGQCRFSRVCGAYLKKLGMAGLGLSWPTNILSTAYEAWHGGLSLSSQH